MNYKYDVSIIIVNYNGKRYIDNLFLSLKEIDIKDIKVQIVFVDNNSSDDSVKYLKEKYSLANLKIVESKENLGFAGGNNLGVKECEGEYIVFLNNDTKVEKRWLSELFYKIKSDSSIGIVNSKIMFFYDFIKLNAKTLDKFLLKSKILVNDKEYLIDNKFCKNILYGENITCFGHSLLYIPLQDGLVDYHIKLYVKDYNEETDWIYINDLQYNINKRGIIELNITKEQIIQNKLSLIQNAGSGINDNFDGYDIGLGEEDSEEYQKEYEINNACGASIIMLKSDFEKVGGFDENFFMYYEDTDLSYRIKRLNKRLIFYPNSIVRHIHTGSSKEWSTFFIFHVVRNKVLFVYKNISKRKAIIINLCNLLNKNNTLRKASISAFKIILANLQNKKEKK